MGELEVLVEAADSVVEIVVPLNADEVVFVLVQTSGCLQTAFERVDVSTSHFSGLAIGSYVALL